jgi:hypothetical protein
MLDSSVALEPLCLYRLPTIDLSLLVGTDADDPLGFALQIFTAGRSVEALGTTVDTEKTKETQNLSKKGIFIN